MYLSPQCKKCQSTQQAECVTRSQVLFPSKHLRSPCLSYLSMELKRFIWTQAAHCIRPRLLHFTSQVSAQQNWSLFLFMGSNLLKIAIFLISKLGWINNIVINELHKAVVQTELNQKIKNTMSPTVYLHYFSTIFHFCFLLASHLSRLIDNTITLTCSVGSRQW